MKIFVEDIKEHLGHYLALVFILAFGVGALVFFQRTPQMQIISVVHHYIEKDLHIRVVIEYITVALLGFLILWSIIIRT